MKSTDSFIDHCEQKNSKEESYNNYNFDITKRLLEKYKPTKGLIAIKGKSERLSTSKAA